jgi:Tse6 toxin immunity protein Tsi6
MPQITSRREFQQRLDRALADMKALLAKTPRFEPYETVEWQLDELKRWTANARELTKDERDQISIGVVVVREFDPQPDVPLYETMENLHDIQGYVRIWPPDGEPPYK